MMSHIAKMIASPVFEDDADKTRMASVLHKLLAYTIVFLLMLVVVLALVDVPERPYFLIGLPVLILALGLDCWVMRRGHVRLSGIIFIGFLWLVFTLFLPFAGGVRSVMVAFYVAGAAVVGLLLGKRATVIHITACGIAGLGMILLQNSPYALPVVFPILPLIGWAAMMLSLGLTIGAVNMVMQRHDAALASLRESEERYRQLFEAESDAIFLIDNATGQILEANHAAAVLYGYSYEELLTKRNTDLSAEPEDTQRVTQTTPVITEQVVTIPMRLHRKRDGTVFPVEITGRFFDWRGRPVHIAAIRDITTRQHTEAVLHEKTEELDHFFTLSLDLLCIADTDGYFLRLNPEWERTLGYPLAELEGRQYLDFVHPDDLQSTLDAVAQLDQQRELLNFENRYRCKDGSYRWIEWRASPRGKLIYAAARDITVRKQAEQALEESEARYRSLFEDNHAVMMIFDKEEGQIIDVNPAACVYYGWSHDEFVTKRIRDIDAMLPEELSHETEAAVREGRRYFLFKHRRADGEIRDVEVYGGTMQLGGKSVYYAIVHDVTERRLAEEALRRSEALYRRAIEVIGAVPYYQEYNPSAYIFMGEGIRQLTGYGPEEMTPELWRSLVQKSVMLDKASDMDRDTASRLARSGQLDVWKSDDYIRTRDGQMRWVMDAAVEIPDEGGRPRSSLGILIDITERKQTEETLRDMNQRLEETLTELRETQKQMMHQERLAAVGQLAAGIAHDFNNILASIVLYTHMSLRSAELPAVLRQRLEVIAQQADRAADLVQQILDFGRQAVLERQPLILDVFLKEVVKLLQRTLPENIQLDLAFEPGDYVIQADPTRIQQVIVNLALNARDAMPAGGTLRFGLQYLHLRPGVPPPLPEMGSVIQNFKGSLAPSTWVCLSVADTGIGMTDTVRAHLFEPFFTTKEVGQGAGLGLAQVYGIVRLHDGYVGVETEIGKGTTFRIYLPASETEVVDSAEETPVAPLGQGEPILLVEDHTHLRAAGESILQELGYHVLTASNGREALTTFRANPEIALVITDLVMPEMGGEALVHELKRLAPTCKVLAITGYTMQVGVRTLKDAGFFDVVHKPFDADTLAQVIHRALTEG